MVSMSEPVSRVATPVAEPSPADPDVRDVLGVGPPRRSRRWTWGVLGALLVAAAGIGSWRWLGTREAEPPWDDVEVQRGALEVTVVAVGTLKPSDTIAVGSELSGLVDEVLVDVNDVVAEGQVLARLDTQLLDDQVAQSRAQVAVASAGVRQAEATVVAARRELARVEHLGSEAVAAQVVDQARDAVAQADAGLLLARAQLGSAQAALRSVRTQRSRAMIRSPVDGVVLARNVDPGQPVISALQAATLFEVAADLDRLELVVDVDEADVGRVSPGRPARFAVPAWPERQWDAEVVRVDIAPKPLEQVVSYPATLSVDNAEGLLRPGMTATATVVSERLDDVLLVASAALRFTPPGATDTGGPVVWTEGPDGVPVAHAVEVLGRDGSTTAIADGAVEVGARVLVERL